MKKTSTEKRDKRRSIQKREARRKGVPLKQYTAAAKEKERLEKQGGDVAKEAAPASGPGKEELLRTAAGRAADKKLARQTRINAKQHLGLYALDQRILIVGDGNFSFSRAMCQNLESGSNVYATCYDGEAALHKKYVDAKEIRSELETKFSATTLVGVDATRLHEVKAFRKAFRRIVFNFPHLGAGEANVEKSVADHQELLTEFFKSAEKCLDAKAPDSAIHVSLKVGEPYKSWKVVQVGRAALPEFDLQNVVPFSFDAWPGYEHRRTAGFDQRVSKKDNEELAKGAKVYIFARKDAPVQGKRKHE